MTRVCECGCSDFQILDHTGGCGLVMEICTSCGKGTIIIHE